MPSAKTLSKWEKVGVVGVDSGQLIVTDPCYLPEFKNDDFMPTGNGPQVEKEKVEYSYTGACERTLMKKGAGSVGEWDGQGVALQTGYGDGVYPVYVRRDGNGRIVRMMVKFS